MLIPNNDQPNQAPRQRRRRNLYKRVVHYKREADHAKSRGERHSRSGHFAPSHDNPPPKPVQHPPKPSSSAEACLSPGTLNYTYGNGTVQNYTNLGGNCFGLDVGEAGSPSISNVTSSAAHNGLYDPFYASITPQTFALAGATIASSILLVLLFLSRTRKPWIQKGAAFATSFSLIIYMAISVNMLKRQYVQGRYDADQLRGINQNLVCNVFSYIACFAIYIAQVQTVMRIFPRKRDKVIIKWTGLFLILLTMIFSGLYQFLQPSAPPPNRRNTSWQVLLEIMPPLSYLFSIALVVIYAACVVYFGIAHRRVAFTIPAGLILALLSLACITMPIIFFCLDIWATFVIGWGQYIRSIASLGSTVIVWEWIERVDEAEAKRDYKSAILGRRIFEDEFEIGSMQKTLPSDDPDSSWHTWVKKIRVPSILSGISEKATEWSNKLQAKLDRRASTSIPQALNKPSLPNLNSVSSPTNGTSQIPQHSTSDDSRTTTTGDDTYTTSYTVTSATSSHALLISGKPPKKKHHYPIARSANRTRQLTRTLSTQSPRIPESALEPSVPREPSPSPLPASDADSAEGRPTSTDAPSFHSRESESRFSVLPGFTTGDYFLNPQDLEKRNE